MQAQGCTRAIIQTIHSKIMEHYSIDYIEQYVPMAKPLAYWHEEALGFVINAYKGIENGYPGIASYALCSGNVRLVLTSAYPSSKQPQDADISRFINERYAGVKRVVLKTSSVREAFANALSKGGIPVQFPIIESDREGYIERAAVRLYDCNELVFLDRTQYAGAFLPGFKKMDRGNRTEQPLFDEVDHIASQLRINESGYWTDYLEKVIGTRLVQRITPSADNTTGMALTISQSPEKALTLVMSEPDSTDGTSKIQENIDTYGSGIHHLAFTTKDIIAAVETLRSHGVEMMNFPASYYELLREDPGLGQFNIDELERSGVLVDKEDGSYLMQKFIKPYGDRPFFFYEIVQRVNGYNGFALKNINMLKRAEEKELERSLATAAS